MARITRQQHRDRMVARRQEQAARGKRALLARHADILARIGRLEEHRRDLELKKLATEQTET